MKYDRKRIAKIAGVNYQQSKNWSLAWKQAWAFVKAEMLAKHKEVTLTFFRLSDSKCGTKKKGDERVITFTTNLSLIPEIHHPKSEGSKIVGFKRVYDLESGGWRSFHAKQLKVA